MPYIWLLVFILFIIFMISKNKFSLISWIFSSIITFIISLFLKNLVPEFLIFIIIGIILLIVNRDFIKKNYPKEDKNTKVKN